MKKAWWTTGRGRKKRSEKKKQKKKRERTRNMCKHQGFHATEVQKTKQKRNKQWHRKDIHSHIHSYTHSMHTPKTLKKWNKKEKALNLPNMMPSFTGPLPVHRGDGRRSGSLALASQDCFTSEAFSPRTVLTENICRCVQQTLQHFTTKMPFLTTSRITFSCLASVAPQADSCWLGHLVTDDVVITDIGGQALDILLHGPESAHKNGIVKTFTHRSIPVRPCTHLKEEKEIKNKNKKRAKCSTYQTLCLRSLVLFLSSVMVVDFQEAWHLFQFGGQVPSFLAVAQHHSGQEEDQ